MSRINSCRRYRSFCSTQNRGDWLGRSVVRGNFSLRAATIFNAFSGLIGVTFYHPLHRVEIGCGLPRRRNNMRIDRFARAFGSKKIGQLRGSNEFHGFTYQSRLDV
jgi:hypothetical protein